MQQKESELDFSPLPDEAAMAQLSYAHWERAEAETMAEYVSRRRTVDLASLVRQVIEEDLNETERAVIRMRYIENLPTAEIARRMQFRCTSVSRCLRNAEEHIRQCLKYVVQYQYDLRQVPFLPLAVRKAMVVAAARYADPADAASRLHKLRVGENLTMKAVAQAVDITPERLRALERGHALPDAGELLRLSAFYDVSADLILKGETPCSHH